MAITYTYEIHDFKIQPTLGDLQKVITAVSYSYIGTDEKGNKSAYPGSTELPAPNTDSITPIEELSPEAVKQWIEANTDVKAMQKIIRANLKRELQTEQSLSTLPWSTAQQEQEIDTLPVVDAPLEEDEVPLPSSNPTI